MENNIYTYEVDHGEDRPSISYGSIINGGKVVAVAFTDQLSNNQRAHEIIQTMLDDDFMEDDILNKLTKIQALI